MMVFRFRDMVCVLHEGRLGMWVGKREEAVLPLFFGGRALSAQAE